MTKANDMAFPYEFTVEGATDRLRNALFKNNGLSKREYFSALFLQSIITANDHCGITNHVGYERQYIEKAAQGAIRYADQLIKELNKGEEYV